MNTNSSTNTKLAGAYNDRLVQNISACLLHGHRYNDADSDHPNRVCLDCGAKLANPLVAVPVPPEGEGKILCYTRREWLRLIARMTGSEIAQRIENTVACIAVYETYDDCELAMRFPKRDYEVVRGHALRFGFESRAVPSNR